MVHALCISFSILSVLTGMRLQTEMYRYLKIYHKHHLGFLLRRQMSSLLLQDHFLVFEYCLSLIGELECKWDDCLPSCFHICNMEYSEMMCYVCNYNSRITICMCVVTIYMIYSSCRCRRYSSFNVYGVILAGMMALNWVEPTQIWVLCWFE